MQTRVQLFLDKNIVKPVIVCLNLFVRLLGKILRINHTLDKKFKVIAVCKYKGMGSIIQSTPLLMTLRKNFPDSKIIFITTKANRELLEKINCVDEIISIDDSSFTKLIFSFPFFILKLISARIEVYLDLEIYSNFSSLITTLSCAKNRIGYYLRSSNYRMGIYTHMMFFNTHTSVSQTYLQLARLLNCHMIYDELYPLQSSSEEIRLSENRMLKFQHEKYIIINPNASDLRIERRWSKENFIALIKKIQETNPGHTIILIGNKKEQSYVNEILLEIKNDERIFSLAGKTNLDGLISLIKNSSLIITNDTGPMHIAFSTEAKTVSLFGPCAPVQHSMMKNNYTLYKKVYCSPCVHDFLVPPCNGNNQCMKLIGVEEVFDAAQLMLRINTDAMPLNKKDQTIYLADEKNVLGKVIR